MPIKSTLFVNGPVLTMDGTGQAAEAVLVEGKTIKAVGPRAALEASARPGARVYDLGGRALLPAFIDPHGHFPEPGLNALFRADLSSPPLGTCRTLADVLDRVADVSRRTPGGQWVVGCLFDQNAIAEERFPTREELDRVSTHHPIWVLHASGHAGAANSLALQRHGVDRTTENPLGGLFGRDARGELDGYVSGMPAMGALGDPTVLQIDAERFAAGFAAAREEYLGQGVTFCQASWALGYLLDFFAGVEEQGDPGIGVLVLPDASLEPALSEGRHHGRVPRGPDLRLGPRKLFADGAFQVQSAWLTKPYFKPFNGDPEYCAAPYVTPERMAVDIAALHGAGHQIHVHANGDAAIDMVLDGFEAALRHRPRKDHRHTLIHCQSIRKDQLERMASLGLTPSFFSAHVFFWGHRHRDVFLGPERAANISPARWAADLGLRFTIHNDAYVTPTRPLHLMWCAVNRITSDGDVLGAHQRLSVEEALRAHTIDAAWQVHLEHERGSIEPGKRADLVVLDRNPLDHPLELKDLRVEETFRDGASVWRRAVGV